MLFGKSKQAYYKRDLEHLSEELAREAFALEFAMAVRQTDPGIGCANLWRIYLREFEGSCPLGRDRFVALLHENDMQLRHRQRGTRTTDSRHNLPLYPDLAKSFIPDAPNQLWVSDITYIPIHIDCERKFCYLTTIMDAYSRKVMAYEVGDSLQTDHSLVCLKRAIANLGENHSGLIHHSDRGVQYASLAYTSTLKSASISISMTQTGNPKDNAQAERINSTIKNELLRGITFHSIEQVKTAIAQALEFYNNRRPHMSLGYQTPAQAYTQSGRQDEKWFSFRRKAIEAEARQKDEQQKEKSNAKQADYTEKIITLSPQGASLRSTTSVQPLVGI